MPDASSNTSSPASPIAQVGSPPAGTRRGHLEPGVAAVVALFEGPLAEHSFPGADWVTLSELEEAVTNARATTDDARAALVRAQESLVASERALVAHEAKLLGRAHRALAYARIYAEDAPELASTIRAIELPPMPVRAAEPGGDLASQPKRRGRPARARSGAPLFEPPSGGPSANDATANDAAANDASAADAAADDGSASGSSAETSLSRIEA